MSTPEQKTLDTEIHPLLSRANLLRLRGQWEDAVALCTEALRRHPKSAAAHSLLGDIYEAQGEADQALHFYSMAVDLNPQGRAEREKLDKLIQARQAALLTEKKKPSPETTPEQAAKPARERTQEWMDKKLSRPRSLMILGITGGGIIMLLLGLGLGMLLWGNRSDLPTPTKPAATAKTE